MNWMGRSDRDKRTKYPIRKRKHDIEILKGVAVVKIVVSIEPAEEAGLVYPAVSRYMHAPVEGLVQRIVQC